MLASAQIEIADQGVGHGGRLHLEINRSDFPFIDQKSVAHHSHVFAPHELLQSVALVQAGDGTGLLIREQREGEVVLVDEFAVGGGPVLADAER